MQHIQVSEDSVIPRRTAVTVVTVVTVASVIALLTLNKVVTVETGLTVDIR